MARPHMVTLCYREMASQRRSTRSGFERFRFAISLPSDQPLQQRHNDADPNGQALPNLRSVAEIFVQRSASACWRA